MKRLHLLCNAHIDPIWMWVKEEGILETLSTYRVAADFCEEYPDFVFNHNESVLYEWVEQFDPPLFERIRKLIAAGRWRVIGGAYLQPDCNMPSGEAMVRQLLIGRKYFLEKFGVVPKTAINFDSFGHARGLVQIFKKSGFDYYIVCRPLQDRCPLPADDFVWEGFDGSRVVCHRGYNSYESHRGEADQKILGYYEGRADQPTGLVLWGVGNHGGGPSRVDYEKIQALAKKLSPQVELVHSHPDAYFAEMDEHALPVVKKPLRHHSVGCYTSQIRIKQAYRALENQLFMVEKMLSAARLNGMREDFALELAEAEKDMAFLQFHDILPGSSIAPAEEAALAQAHHGREILDRVRIRAFWHLLNGQARPKDDSIPVFVYNPHPYPVKTVIECEFNLPDQNKDAKRFAFPRVYAGDRPLPCQVLHEDSNFNVDWRKRVAFLAELAPSCMSRYDCRVEYWSEEPARPEPGDAAQYAFDNGRLRVLINTQTGAMDQVTVDGVDYLAPGSLVPMVMDDDYDSWGNTTRSFRNLIARFQLMRADQVAAYSGNECSPTLAPVRVIEDGEVQTVVEALFQYRDSKLTRRLHLPKQGTEIRVSVKVSWDEPMKALKLPIVTRFPDAKYFGQTMFGRDELENDGGEAVAQRWTCLASESENRAVSIVNLGTYGSDCKDGEARLTLLRSPGYSAGCSDFSRRKPLVMEQDRANDFIDLGRREFTFFLNFGPMDERLDSVDNEAAIANEAPYALSSYPSGEGDPIRPLIEVAHGNVQLTAFKPSVAQVGSYVIRLFEPTGSAQEVSVRLPCLDLQYTSFLAPFEVATLLLDPEKRTIAPTTLMEGLC
jgi:alpha-mannosidase